MTPAHELDRQTRDAIATAFGWPPGMDIAPYIRDLPRGAVIATADLVDCWEIAAVESINGRITNAFVSKPPGVERVTQQDLLLGEWSIHRYAWELANVEILPQPVPVRGKQGLWNWEEK